MIAIEAWILWDFINNADSSNDPLGVLLEAPLGGYRRLKSPKPYLFALNLKNSIAALLGCVILVQTSPINVILMY